MARTGYQVTQVHSCTKSVGLAMESYIDSTIYIGLHGLAVDFSSQWTQPDALRCVIYLPPLLSRA